MHTKILRWVIPTLLLLGMLGFSMLSYPMVRPGFDVWWHLGAIDAPELLDPSVFPTRRILWHHLWNQVFDYLYIEDYFFRSLVIHRTQSVVTVLALALAAYFLLKVLSRPYDTDHGSIWTAALLAPVIWLVMSGTRSVAHDGGTGADATQSWLLWYSVNYQISLPLVLLAMSLLLSAVDQDRSARSRMLLAISTVAVLCIAALAHAAEVVYFLLFAGLVAILHLRGRQGMIWAAVLLVASSLMVGFALHYSYAVPRLLTYMVNGEFAGAVEAMRQEGKIIRGAGLARLDTGWHALHALSLAALMLGILVLRGRRISTQTNGFKGWQASAAVLLTAAFPLALMTNVGTGLFAFLTHTYIAWRFSLASLLFIGVPFAALVLSETFLKGTGPAWRQMAAVGFVLSACTLAVWGEHDSEKPSPGLAFGQSLVRSLSAEEMFFGLSPMQQSRLQNLSSSLKPASVHSPLCTDIFTAYYLFFLERYHWVSLPPALEYLPGYRTSTSRCTYPTDNPDLRGMGLSGVHVEGPP